jgi:hypothetical protein
MLLTTSGYADLTRESSFLYAINSTTGAPQCIQRIPTLGAQSWRQFRIQGMTYVAVANYLNPQTPSGGQLGTTTVAWSEIYRFNESFVPQPGSSPCTNTTPGLVEGPVRTVNRVTRIMTQGAAAMTTFQVFNKTKNGQVLLLAIANYFDSQQKEYRTPSKVYMLGVKTSTFKSKFGANDQNFAKSCGDGKPCSNDNDCRAGQCDADCIITSVEGKVVNRDCGCTNNRNLKCSSDEDCNRNNVCEERNVPVPEEPDGLCWTGAISFASKTPTNSIAPIGSITACEVQHLDTYAARDVTHLSVDGKDFLVFAQESERHPTLVFLYNTTTMLFQLLQTIDTRMASSVRGFASLKTRSQYLVIASQKVVRMQLWNGTLFGGPLSAATLPADTAAGQDIATFDAISVDVLRTADQNDFLVIGQGSNAQSGRLSSKAEVLSSTDTVAGNLRRPVAAMLSPTDNGLFLYVVSVRGISVYTRNITSGLLTYNSDKSWTSTSDRGLLTPPSDYYSLNPEDSTPFYGYPLRSLTSAIMSRDGANIYAANFYDDSLLIFTRNITTGALNLTATLTDIPGMGGPKGLHISTDDAILTVAGSLEHAVVVFRRSRSTGLLTIIDSAMQGQRDVATFARNNSKASPNATYTMLGENRSWANSATAFKYISVCSMARGYRNESDMRRIAAIAASNGSASATGPAVVLQWNDSSATFEIIQEIEVGGAVDVDLFEMDPTGAEGKTLEAGLRLWLAVASATGKILLYVWDPDKAAFGLHQELPQMELPYDSKGCACLCADMDTRSACFDQGVVRLDASYASARNCTLLSPPLAYRSIKYFAFGAPKQHYIAAAVYRAHGNCGKVYSMVQRWNIDVPQRTPDGDITWGAMFQPYQAIPTHGANSIEYASLPRMPGTGFDELLMLACYADGKEGLSPILRFNPDAYNPTLLSRGGLFQLHSNIPTVGGSALRHMRIRNLGDFLAVANRRKKVIGNLAGNQAANATVTTSANSVVNDANTTSSNDTNTSTNGTDASTNGTNNSSVVNGTNGTNTSANATNGTNATANATNASSPNVDPLQDYEGHSVLLKWDGSTFVPYQVCISTEFVCVCVCINTTFLPLHCSTHTLRGRDGVLKRERERELVCVCVSLSLSLHDCSTPSL